MVLKFGRHKGKSLRDVPGDYLKWLVANNDGRNSVAPFEAELQRRAGRQGHAEEPQERRDYVPHEKAPAGSREWMQRSRLELELEQLRSAIVELQQQVAELQEKTLFEPTYKAF